MTGDVEIRMTDDGPVIRVRVVPRAKITDLDGIRDGAIRIRLKAPPVDGAANKALCSFLAKLFGCRKSDVEIISGERSRSKTVRVRGASRETIESLLQDRAP